MDSGDLETAILEVSACCQCLVVKVSVKIMGKNHNKQRYVLWSTQHGTFPHGAAFSSAPSMIQEPAAPLPPGSLFEMQILKFHL